MTNSQRSTPRKRICANQTQLKRLERLGQPRPQAVRDDCVRARWDRRWACTVQSCGIWAQTPDQGGATRVLNTGIPDWQEMPALWQRWLRLQEGSARQSCPSDENMGFVFGDQGPRKNNVSRCHGAFRKLLFLGQALQVEQPVYCMLILLSWGATTRFPWPISLQEGNMSTWGFLPINSGPIQSTLPQTWGGPLNGRRRNRYWCQRRLIRKSSS